MPEEMTAQQRKEEKSQEAMQAYTRLKQKLMLRLQNIDDPVDRWNCICDDTWNNQAGSKMAEELCAFAATLRGGFKKPVLDWKGIPDIKWRVSRELEHDDTDEQHGHEAHMEFKESFLE